MQAFARSSEAAVYQRLRSEVYALLAAVELDDSGRLIPPGPLAQPRLAAGNSGLYAAVTVNGADRWQSPSSLGSAVVYPSGAAAGEFVTARITGSGAIGYLALTLRVDWELDDGAVVPVSFHVAEETGVLDGQQTAFRLTLLAWLVSVGGLVLFAQLVLVRLGLAPLRRAAENLEAISVGRGEALTDDYPLEIAPLTDTVNRFIGREREQQARYRQALGDLAHSLKTPLAVLRNELSGDTAQRSARLSPEISRMQAIIDRELSRAATAGPAVLGGRVPLGPVVQRLVNSLGKVYADKQVTVRRNIPDSLCFAGDETDLMEMLGNLLDNAWRYCGSVVTINGSADDGGQMLRVEIVDDGPGLDAGLAERVLERGVTSRATGTGLGLPLVREIAASYGGNVRVAAPDDPGMRVILELPMAVAS